MTHPARPPLSQTAECMERELLADTSDPLLHFDCDVLVVGSGYGGAVAATRLAALQEAHGAPCRVWVLERGLEHRPGGFPSRWAELPGQVRLGLPGRQQTVGGDEGLYDLRLGHEVSVLLGNGLGGGSLINAGVMLEPESEVFSSGWPKSVTAAALQPAFERARQMLTPEATAAERTTAKFELLQTLAGRHRPPDTAPALAAQTVPLSINVGSSARRNAADVLLTACTRCGDCMTGCNVGAKGSLDTNYLAQAVQFGTRVFTGATVMQLAGDDEAGWTVHWQYTQATLRPGQRRKTLRARRVVLAAGSLGSTEILLRSRTALALPPAEHSALGAGFSLNGDVMIAGVGHAQRIGIAADPEADPFDDQQRRVGPTITGQVQVPAHGDEAGFRLQDFAVPAALRELLGEVTAWRDPFLALQPPALPSQPAQDWAARLGLADPHVVADHTLERTSLFGAMGLDQAQGRIELQRPAQAEPAHATQLVLKWPHQAAPAGTYDFDRPARWLTQVMDEAAPLSTARLLGGLAPAISVHPLGGCRMADGPDAGVVNACGQVFRSQGSTDVHQTLVVLDGAVVPGALGVNPALTIAALAEHALQQLKGQWGLRPREASAPTAAEAHTAAPSTAEPTAAGPADQPAPSARRHELGASHQRWTLREVLQGPARIDGEHHWARLSLSFEDLPGWRRALQLTHRVLNITSARLVLHAVPEGFDAFDLDEASLPPVVAEAELQGSALLSWRAATPDPGPGQAGHEPAALSMVYRLAVVAVSGPQRPVSLQVGARLQGVKTLRLDEASAAPADNPLRAFTEMAVSLQGQAVGRWALDMGDLATRDGALMALAAASNLPDALGDLGALASFALRSALLRLLPALAALKGSREVQDALVEQLALRDGLANVRALLDGLLQEAGNTLPDALLLRLRAERRPEVCAPDGAQTYTPPDGAPWRLCRYAGSGVPVLLVHGLGTSGSMFTHPAIGTPLATWWRDTTQGRQRDVWVLDLSSSVVQNFESAAPAGLSVQSIARDEIPAAIAQVCAVSGQAQVDVVAHCMGGVMFVLAALGNGNPLQGRVRRAVVSQTGPLVRLSPVNRLRATLASALLPLAPQLDVLDPTEPGSGAQALLTNAAAALFPYPDDDAFKQKLEGQEHADALRDLRARTDLLFGQLFEAGAMSTAALQALPALFGPVRLRLLAEALNFLQHDMLTESDGRNAVLRADRLQAQFNFPVLFVHGRRNRVFDWQGALAGAALVARLRGEHWPEAGQRTQDQGTTAWRSSHGAKHHPAGPGSVELAVFDAHGHLDCLTGEQAHTQVFPFIDHFLAAPAAPAPARPRPSDPRELEWPWLGPMLGWVRQAPGFHALAVDVVLHPSQRRSGSHGVVVVPLRGGPEAQSPDLDHARWLHWPGARARRWPTPGADGAVAGSAAQAAQAAALTLRIDPRRLPGLGRRFAVLTVHLDRRTQQGRAEAMPRSSQDWLDGGYPLFGELRVALLRSWAERQRAAQPAPLLELHPAMLDAADQGRAPAAGQPALDLALASCQYPPLLPGPVAEAAWRRLLEETRTDDAPQLLLLAGDQVYLDAVAALGEAPREQEAPTVTAVPRLDRDYARSFGLPALRAVAARLPMWPLPDDHEVQDHWQGHADPDTLAAAAVSTALQAYERFQRLLAPDAPFPPPSRDARPPGLPPPGYGWRAYPAGVPVYALDTRSQRALRTVDNLATAELLPDADIDALLEALAAEPRHAVKLLLCSVPLLPPERRSLAAEGGAALRSDTWSGFPASAQRLLQGLCDRDIRHLVLLAGDSHLSSVSSLRLQRGTDRPALTVISVVSSGLYTPWPFANQRPEDLVLDGPVQWARGQHTVQGHISLHAMSAANGHARLRIQPRRDGSPTLRVELHAADGGVVGHTFDLGTETPRTGRRLPAGPAPAPAPEPGPRLTPALTPALAAGPVLAPARAPAPAPLQSRTLELRGRARLHLVPPGGRLQSPEADLQFTLQVQPDGRWLLPPASLGVVWPADSAIKSTRLERPGEGRWLPASPDMSLTLPLSLGVEVQGKSYRLTAALTLDSKTYQLDNGQGQVSGRLLDPVTGELALAGRGRALVQDIGLPLRLGFTLQLDLQTPLA